MVTHFWRDTASDLSVGGALGNHSILDTSATAVDLFPSIKVGDPAVSYYAWTPAGFPSTQGSSTGTYSAEVNVTAGNTGILLTIVFARVNSAGTVQAEQAATSQNASAGVHTFTVNNPALGTWNSGDRLRAELEISAAAGHGNQSCTIRVNTTDSEVTFPTVAPVQGMVRQSSFRGYDDDAAQGSATPKAAEGTSWTQDVGETFRIRYVVQEFDGNTVNNLGVRLQWDDLSGAWNDVTTSSSGVVAVGSTHITDGGTTTQQLSGTGTFAAGELSEDGLADTVLTDVPASGNTEFEFVVQLVEGDWPDADSLRLRLVYDDDTVLDSYTSTPVLTTNVTGHARVTWVQVEVPAAPASPGTTASIPLTLDVAADTATTHDVSASVPLSAALDTTAEAQHQATADLPLTVDTVAATAIEHEATASVDLAIDQTASVVPPPNKTDVTIPLTLDVAGETSTTHEVTTSVPLTIDVTAEAATTHEATADSTDLTINVTADSGIEHEAATSIDLTIDQAVVTDAPVVGGAEATASIDLTLDIAGDTSAAHEVTASVPLTLDVDAAAAADHEAATSVPLTVDVEATSISTGGVRASIPLSLDVATETSIEHEATAALPLELGTDAVTATDHEATTSIPLEIDQTAVSDAPTIGEAAAQAAIPLEMDVAAETATTPQVGAVIPLTIDVGPDALAQRQVITGIPLELSTAATAAEPTIFHYTDRATWTDTATPDRWSATATTDRWMGTMRANTFIETETPDRWTGTIRPGHFAGDTTSPSPFGGDTRRPQRFATTATVDRWAGTPRPMRFYITMTFREGEGMALTFVDIGPYTENEVPEQLMIRWLHTHADGTTSGLELHGQDPAWTVAAYIEKPSGAVVERVCEILDPATLETEFPNAADQMTNGDEGWVRLAFAAGDFDEVTTADEYGIQLTADNGTLLLKSADVWQPEVNAGPASADVLV